MLQSVVAHFNLAYFVGFGSGAAPTCCAATL
uniref:Sulfite exporter TauE/SafE family protein n=1 Tax=Macrostomum lignano TaxID=282301 RepID=A0A1I8FP55_9PLAT